MTFSAIVLAAALNAGNAEFDRTAAEGAARITIDRAAAAIAERGLPKGSLARAMLADPAAHRTREASKKACREIWGRSAEESFRKEAAAVLERLSLEGDFHLEMPKGAKAAMFGKFEDAFGAERETAVAEQAKTLATAIRPDEEEFEKKDDESLRREMAERIVAEQKTAVFEENLDTVATEIADPIIASGHAERKRQIEYLKRARSDAASPKRLAGELSEKLAANVEERRKKAKPSEAWGVFPSVAKKTLAQVVEKRMTDRLVAHVESVRIDVSPEKVEAMVASNPGAHAKAKASERIFAALYAERTLSEALEKAVAAADPDDRAELREYLASLADGDAPLKAVDRVVRRDVMPKWREARETLAKKASAATWPSLADGTWFPPAELADATAARSDYDEAVRLWRKMDAMKELAEANGGRVLLEETERDADMKVSSAFGRARSAIAAQNAIVDEVHPEILADARARKASFFRRTPDLAAITEMLTASTEKEWAETREATLWPDGKAPANADEQHAALFPSVRRKIELLARQILEEMNTPAAERSKPAEPAPKEKPEEPPKDSPAKNQPDEQDDLEMLGLSVERIGGELEVKLLSGKKVISRERVPSNASSFKGAMERLTRRLSGEVLGLE